MRGAPRKMQRAAHTKPPPVIDLMIISAIEDPEIERAVRLLNHESDLTAIRETLPEHKREIFDAEVVLVSELSLLVQALISQKLPFGPGFTIKGHTMTTEYLVTNVDYHTFSKGLTIKIHVADSANFI